MIKLTGTKEDGYVLSVQDKRYKDDFFNTFLRTNLIIHITHEELKQLQTILAKKIK